MAALGEKAQGDVKSQEAKVLYISTNIYLAVI